MTELERLFERRIEAVGEFRKLQDKQKKELAEAIAIEEKRLTAEFNSKYGKAIKAAHDAAKESIVAYEAALIAGTTTNMPFPAGTKLIGWGKEKHHGWGPNKNPIKILATGFVEIVKRDTVFPGNASKYHRPEVGGVIVRLAKANGTAGLSFDKYQYGKYRWLPEGLHPDDAKKPVREIKV